MSHATKAEVLAATFHLLTDHMPEIWKTVPAFLRGQIKQAMCDCSIEHEDFSEQDLKDCVEYCQWLNKKFPQPKPMKPRYLHYAIVADTWKDKVTGTGQIGCMEAENKKQATSQLCAGDTAHVERMPRGKCPVCKEDKIS